MTDIISHRGPDGEGFYIADSNQEKILGGNNTKYDQAAISQPKSIYNPEGNITDHLDFELKLGLGQRRLAILDLSPLGQQPLAVANGNYWICYNGEVYNHAEIRQELEGLGYSFISHTDTEVILTAYQEWGKGCLSKFNGMFAFLIYDKLNNKLFIARDRFGIKPLYYHQDQHGIYFASEIKQFTVLPDWKAKLNHQRAFDFLVHGLIDHTCETLLQNVYQLRGGEFAEINLYQLPILQENGLVRQQWYELKDKSQCCVSSHPHTQKEKCVLTQNKQDYAKACADFRNIFIDAVKLHLKADVEVGSCLSGGLDSSAIVSVMAKRYAETAHDSNTKIKTFSACSQHKAFDESEYIHTVVEETKVTPFYCYPELVNLFAAVRKITWYQDEPFGSTSIYAQWQVFELAQHQHLKVMLDGQGADEALAGYHGLYFQTLLNQFLEQGKLGKFVKELYLLHKIHGFNFKLGILKAILSLFPHQIKNMVGKLYGKQQYLINWLNPDKLKYKIIDPFIATGLDKSNIKNTLYSQLVYNNLPMLLHWEDRNSMAHSIESRVPFLDHRLVEFIYALPDDYKISNGITKRILRDGLNGIIPDRIKMRMTKLGFVTPEEVWVRESSDLFRRELELAITKSQGILCREQVLQIFSEVVDKKRPFDFWLWRIISFGQWLDLFKVEI